MRISENILIKFAELPEKFKEENFNYKSMQLKIFTILKVICNAKK